MVFLQRQILNLFTHPVNLLVDLLLDQLLRFLYWVEWRPVRTEVVFESRLVLLLVVSLFSEVGRLVNTLHLASWLLGQWCVRLLTHVLIMGWLLAPGISLGACAICIVTISAILHIKVTHLRLLSLKRPLELIPQPQPIINGPRLISTTHLLILIIPIGHIGVIDILVIGFLMNWGQINIRRWLSLMTDIFSTRLINKLLMFGHLYSVVVRDRQVIVRDRQVAVLLERLLFGHVLARTVLRRVALLWRIGREVFLFTWAMTGHFGLGYNIFWRGKFLL
jgi:hypothetical protein